VPKRYHWREIWREIESRDTGIGIGVGRMTAHKPPWAYIGIDSIT
jgi:hypothetical protein